MDQAKVQMIRDKEQFISDKLKRTSGLPINSKEVKNGKKRISNAPVKKPSAFHNTEEGTIWVA